MENNIQVKEQKLIDLIKWFVNETKVGLSADQCNILFNYYMGVSQEKIFEDFEVFYRNPQSIFAKLQEMLIVGVDDLKDSDGSKYIKINFSNGSFKVYRNTLSEDGSSVFAVCMSNGEGYTTNFFLSLVKGQTELSSEEIKNLHSKNEEVKDGGNGLSNQKSLGTHPGTGNVSLKWFEEGFMNILLMIFLTGISTGIILMIVLNSLAK